MITRKITYTIHGKVNPFAGTSKPADTDIDTDNTEQPQTKTGNTENSNNNTSTKGTASTGTTSPKGGNEGTTVLQK